MSTRIHRPSKTTSSSGSAASSVPIRARCLSGVHLENVPGHQPVKAHAQRGQVLLDGGRGELSLQILDEGGDVEGPARCGRCLIWAVKNSRTRRAASGVGVNRGRGLKRGGQREDESGARRDSLSVEAGVAHLRGLRFLVSSRFAEDPATNGSIKLRALKQIAAETAADVEGMWGDLVGKIEQLERLMAEDTVPPELTNE